jgi:uncharacterized protein (TIGR03085 family)
LALRERDLRAGPGILFGGPFARYTDKLMVKEMARPYEQIVGRVRTPPPGPLSIGAVRRAISFSEYLTHHEDVRRPNGRGPRNDRPDLQAETWKTLERMGGFMVRKAKTGRAVTLMATGTTMGSKTLGDGPKVSIAGEPVELLLFLQGRRTAAIVDMTGASDDVVAVERGNFGI